MAQNWVKITQMDILVGSCISNEQFPRLDCENLIIPSILDRKTYNNQSTGTTAQILIFGLLKPRDFPVRLGPAFKVPTTRSWLT